MPIGASKVGALGGLVPGGSVTFNTSGTWDVPPGVKIVSITGKGGTGNPGNAGNPGNPGNPGTGGGGGAGGGGSAGNCPVPNSTRCGGLAYKRFVNQSPQGAGAGLIINPGVFLGGPSCCFAAGGGFPTPSVFNPGQSGGTGNAGTSGNAGNPGNAGCSSSALCNTFPGGCGGNAGVAGAAGNGGTGGQGGGVGGQRQFPAQGGQRGGNPGPAGNGGGAGGRGPLSLPQEGFPFPSPGSRTVSGGQGGGGAGVVNSGGNGVVGAYFTNPQPYAPTINQSPKGGFGGCANAAVVNNPIGLQPTFAPAPTSTMGGYGASFTAQGGRSVMLFTSPSPTNRNSRPQFNPSCANSAALQAIFRSGGGGASGLGGSFPIFYGAGGGGGGGGRGNAGNAGGNSPTPSGQAATPLTFNCVPVTPGTPTPITVASPGGQVVISWNPQ